MINVLIYWFEGRLLGIRQIHKGVVDQPGGSWISLTQVVMATHLVTNQQDIQFANGWEYTKMHGMYNAISDLLWGGVQLLRIRQLLIISTGQENKLVTWGTLILHN